MSENIELHLFGQVLRLNCPQDKQAALRESAQRLDERVAEFKERTGILQLDRVLSIVALNLSFELDQEKQKNAEQQVIFSKLEQFDANLNQALAKLD
ncbi:cell division protein ZapA [Pasteurellaceae bacterium TAE3-ERU1]|uniref:cell division protein ZapA n=1 Tax=Spirabiliibacterium mucosae TaxID=28156 RepID=UPI001AAC9DD2|nr:cell division protein ZapA [Spirabiliibacterium mucosae]MBE2897546.1 cell division protein ZapA [Spirabiliibacterium mucosae]MBV7388389.1 cell division protein ZapA [Pasteurellaceae bacterium TAE3-ERU1]